MLIVSVSVWQFVKQKFHAKDFPMRLLEDFLISIKEGKVALTITITPIRFLKRQNKMLTRL